MGKGGAEAAGPSENMGIGPLETPIGSTDSANYAIKSRKHALRTAIDAPSDAPTCAAPAIGAGAVDFGDERLPNPESDSGFGRVGRAGPCISVVRKRAFPVDPFRAFARKNEPPQIRGDVAKTVGSSAPLPTRPGHPPNQPTNTPAFPSFYLHNFRTKSIRGGCGPRNGGTIRRLIMRLFGGR